MILGVLGVSLFAACNGAPTDEKDAADDTSIGDSGDSGGDSDSAVDDTGGPIPDSLGDATATFVGGPSYASGCSLLGPGDVNGDGHDDVVIGAYYGNRACWFAGPVAPGRHDLTATVELGGPDGCLAGEGTYDFAAYTLTSAGDFDGDGTVDFFVGAVGNGDNGANAGKVYLVRGPAPTGSTSLAASYATWTGEAGADYAGIGLQGGGDLTGDGVDDFLFGASGNDAGGAGGGKAYLVPGPPTSGAHLLSEATTTFVGTSTGSGYFGHGSLGGGDLVGDSLASPGDVDGDGIADLALGAGGSALAGANTGLVAVFHGPLAEGQQSIYDADWLLYGPQAGAYAGSPIAASGDLTGDGLADLLVSADGVNGGVVYLVAGADRSGQDLVSNAAVSFLGELDQDQAGAGLAAPGDITGDGNPDIVIGAPANDRVGLDAGTAYVYSGPFPAGVYELSAATWVLAGEQIADNAARAVEPAGDGDGDGRPDLLVGALYNDEGGAFSGKAYLLSGG